MKKYRIIIILFLAVNTLISCEGILDPSSNSTFTEETTFSNLDFAQKAVFGIYDNLVHLNMYGSDVLFYKTGSDIEHLYGALDNQRRSLAQYTFDEGNTLITTQWNMFYACIERANLCIDNMPKSAIWNGEYANQARALYAEAIVLRAFCYSELVFHWGDVPFTTHSTQDGDNFYLPKTNRDEILEFLVEDLKNAEEYLPWMTTTAERISKGFLKGLRARIALAYAGYSLRNGTHKTERGRNWQQYYQIANEECKAIVQNETHRMNPSFENVFRGLHAFNQDLTNKEILWELPFGRAKSGRLAQVLGMRFCTSPADPVYGRAVGEFSPPLSWYYTFTRGDKRRDFSIELFNYMNRTMNGLNDRLSKQQLVQVHQMGHSKWRRSLITPAMGGGEASRTETGVNFPIMRYTDVVLLLAETENEINGGPTQIAKDALAQVRQRAFPEALWDKHVTHYIDSVSASKEKFFNAIVDERGWEFGGELIRKADLVRWNLLGDRLDKMKSDFMKIIDNDPEFDWVPDVLYWRLSPTNDEVIEIYNKDFRVDPANAPAGYTAEPWFGKLKGKIWTGAAMDQYDQAVDYVNVVVRGYNKTKNNHLFPLSTGVINASNNTLTNDQLVP